MDFELKNLRPGDAVAHDEQALAMLLGRDDTGAAFRRQGKGGAALAALLDKARKSGDFGGRPGELLGAWGATGLEAPRLWLAGVGTAEPKDLRRAAAAAVQAAQRSGARTLTLCLARRPGAARLMSIVMGAAEAGYEYTTTKSAAALKKEEEKAPRSKLTRIVLAFEGADDEERERAFARAVSVARGVELAREWANRPANYATPTMLADAARQLARRHKALTCEVLDAKAMERLGMGALLSVARGAHEPPRLVVLHYQGAAKGAAPVALVGKGITFDSGGISLKPGAGMEEMKYDMSGAASVLGVMQALVETAPAINVVGLMALSENMPGSKATHPGDVVTSMSGQTIEVINTDAEGRLVLCDALTYAARFSPRAVVDIATLTGACVIALGNVRSGLYSNDDVLATALLEAGDAALDAAWRMPLDDEYAEQIKSRFADVANTGGRPAGSVTAAKFLQRFVGEAPWAHLDIAGTAWKSGKSKGATGRPVGLLVHWLLAQADAAPAKKPAAARKAAAAAKTVKAEKAVKAVKAAKPAAKAAKTKKAAAKAKS